MSMQKSGSPSSWLTCTDGIAAQWQDLLLLLARVLFGWTFVISGWGKLMNIPGFATRYASLLMLLFIIIAAFSSHRYWAAEPAQVANQSAHFWKAVTMMG